MFEILSATINQTAVDKVCGDAEAIVRLVGKIVSIFQVAIPIILVVMGLVALGKAVTSGKDDEVKKATSGLIKKIIFAAAIFFVVAAVKLIVGIVTDNGDSNMSKCWNLIESPWSSSSSSSDNGGNP